MIPCVESSLVAHSLAMVTYALNYLGGENMTEIVDGLWVGNIASAWDTTTLEKHNIRDVVCITQFGAAAAFAPETLNYHIVKLQDVPESNIKDELDAAADFVRDAIQAGRPVLVHCNQGKSRSATVAAAYLVKHREYDPTQALSTLRDRRPQICPNPGFVRQLYAFASGVQKGSKFE